LTCGLADAAHAFVAVEGWVPLGFARLSDFAREHLDRSGRWVTELAVLGRALAAHPALRVAVLGGDGEAPLGRAAALVIARAGSERGVEQWIAFARRVTVRELVQAVHSDRAGAQVDLNVDASPGRAVDRKLPGDDSFDSNSSGDDEDAVCVQFDMPRWMRGCFVETLDLHRAVSGHEATLSSFVEALAAEAAAGPNPPDVVTERLHRGIPVRVKEAALARVNERWKALRRATQESAPMSASMTDEDADLVLGDGGGAGVIESDDDGGGSTVLAARHDRTRREKLAGSAARRLQWLVQTEDRVDRDLGDLLSAMARHGDWTSLGFASAAHYACERLGMPRRTAESRMAASNALRRLAHVRAAYRQGRIGLEAAMLLHRLLPQGAGEAMQRRWIEHAERVTIKRLRDEIQMFQVEALDDALAGEGSGWPGQFAADSRPPASRAPEAAQVSPAFPERPATDEEWHGSLYRAPGRTRRKLRHCMPRWDAATPTSSLHAADVFLRLRLACDIAEPFLAAVESERRRLTRRAEAVESSEGGTARPDRETDPVSCRLARIYVDRCRRVPAWVGLLALLEDYANTWDDPAGFPKRRWSKTYERANWRCMAPGCTSRRWHDDHHIRYRSGGGGHEDWNQLCLCRFHHQQGEHGRFARVRGRAPIDIVWRLGTKALARWYRNEVRLDRGLFDARVAAGAV